MYIHTPLASTNKYLTPSIVSSSGRLQAYQGRTSLPSQGDRGIPSQEQPDARHEKKRLDTEPGMSVVLHPPKASKKAHFPDEGDIDDSAGNRTGIPLARISPDPSQPPYRLISPSPVTSTLVRAASDRPKLCLA